MGRRGPPPKPSRLKLLTGNPGHRPIKRNEPKPRSTKGVPQPPAYLGKIAKQQWRIAAADLHRQGLLTRVDHAMLALYCMSFARALECDKAVRELGDTFMTEKGYVCQRPEVAIGQKERALAKQFASEFGLTPSSRTRIEVPAPPAVLDEAKDFLFATVAKHG